MNDKAIELIRDLALKLGTTTEQLFQVLVESTQRQGAIDLAVAGVLFVIAALSGITALYCTHKRSLNVPNDDAYLGVTVAACVLGILCFIGTCVNVGNGVTDYFNPRGAAIAKILKLADTRN